MKLDQRFMQLFSSEYQQIEADLSVGCCWGCGGVVVVLPAVVSVFVLVFAFIVVILAECCCCVGECLFLLLSVCVWKLQKQSR